MKTLSTKTAKYNGHILQKQLLFNATATQKTKHNCKWPVKKKTQTAMSSKMTLTQAHTLKTKTSASDKVKKWSKNAYTDKVKKHFMLKTKYKSRLLHALKPKTQQHSVDVKVKNQTDTKFKFLNNII